MKKEFDLKIDGGTLESIKIDSSNSLIVATYKRDVAEFKAGDILIDAHDEDGAKFISIFKEINEDKGGMFSAHIVLDIFDTSGENLDFDSSNWDYIENNRLATDEEKQLLFDALKKEGKRWNEEKLEIENIKPEFKRGDILVDDLGTESNGAISIFKCINSEDDDYRFFDAYVVVEAEWGSAVEFDQTGWDYIEDQRLATEEEKQLLFLVLKKQGLRWNAEKLEIEKLDISEIVVDYGSAIKYLGVKDTLLVFKSYDRVEKFNAQIKLQLIAEAWNKFDEFEADWENSDQYKHYPIFRVEDGKIEFSGVSFVRGILNPHTSNFSFKSEERAKQFTEQFIDLFKVALGF